MAECCFCCCSCCSFDIEPDFAALISCFEAAADQTLPSPQDVEEKRLAEEAKAKMSLADSGGVDEAAVAKVRELVAAGNPKKTADRVRKLDVEGGVPARMRVLLQVRETHCLFLCLVG